MKRMFWIICLGLILTLAFAGCGDSVNYEQAKQHTGEDTIEYLLHVSGMT